ncbi:MAG: flagellar export protein FliJ [Hyphomicrobiaceae bacterium]
MKAREVALRLKRFDVEEKARKVRDLGQMIADFEQLADDLDRQIVAEEDRTGIRDKNHFAYSTYARAAAQRRRNLQTSIDDLKRRMGEAEAEHRDALSDLDDAADVAQKRSSTQAQARSPLSA